MDNFSPYTTIDDSNGFIYKHYHDNYGDHADWVGQVKDGQVYNSHDHYLGYGGTDGKIYDEHDHYIGWVDTTGHVYNSAGVRIYDTTMGVVGGAAYMLSVYMGGVR